MALRILTTLCSFAQQGARQLSSTSRADFQHLGYSRLSDQRIGIIELSSPPVNALSASLLEELAQATAKVKEDKLSAVIFTGKGNFFSAGADLTAFTDIKRVRQLLNAADHAMDSIYDTSQSCSVIGAAQGIAFGGGLEVLLRTHLIFAAETLPAPSNKDLSLALPECKIGLCPGAGGSVFLPLKMNDPILAQQMIDTGDSITVKMANKKGLVDFFLQQSSFMPRVIQYVQQSLADPSLFPRFEPFSFPGVDAALATERAKFWSLVSSESFQKSIQERLSKK